MRSDPYEPTSTGIGVGRGGAAHRVHTAIDSSDFLLDGCGELGAVLSLTRVHSLEIAILNQLLTGGL